MLGPTTTPALFEGDFLPPVDVLRDNERFVVRLDLPGMKKDDIEISVLNDRLYVRGTKQQDDETQEKSFHRRERVYGSFERVIELPNPVDGDKITATFTDGVLVIQTPIREEAKARQIAIEVK